MNNEDYKPYETIRLLEIKINDVLCKNARAYFVRKLKNNKVQIQINGILLIVDESSITKDSTNE